MKRVERKKFRQCILEPVEREAPLPIPGVPEHFNYGVFFDDDYDYMRYLKSATEFQEKSAYRITGIPEDEVLEVEDPELTENPREPVVDEQPIPEGLGLDSDTEILEEASELEDNFVELAGGPAVKDEESGDEASPKDDEPHSSHTGNRDLKDMFPQNKVLMMERFLYGDNERDFDNDKETSDRMDESFEDQDEASLLNAEFEKLLLKYKNRGGSANQSVMTGTSMMSEGLQYALSRDTRTLQHQRKKHDDVEVLDDEVRQKTIYRNDQLTEATSPSSSSEESDDGSSERPPDIMSVQSEQSFNRPNVQYLTVSLGKSRASSRQPSITDLAPKDEPEAHVRPLDPSALTRRKGESLEDKRLRKVAVKQHRRERRKVRKANQENFRVEHERQLKVNTRMVTIG